MRQVTFVLFLLPAATLTKAGIEEFPQNDYAEALDTVMQVSLEYADVLILLNQNGASTEYIIELTTFFKDIVTFYLKAVKMKNFEFWKKLKKVKTVFSSMIKTYLDNKNILKGSKSQKRQIKRDMSLETDSTPFFMINDMDDITDIAKLLHGKMNNLTHVKNVTKEYIARTRSFFKINKHRISEINSKIAILEEALIHFNNFISGRHLGDVHLLSDRFHILLDPNNAVTPSSITEIKIKQDKRAKTSERHREKRRVKVKANKRKRRKKRRLMKHGVTLNTTLFLCKCDSDQPSELVQVLDSLSNSGREDDKSSFNSNGNCDCDQIPVDEDYECALNHTIDAFVITMINVRNHTIETKRHYESVKDKPKNQLTQSCMLMKGKLIEGVSEYKRKLEELCICRPDREKRRVHLPMEARNATSNEFQFERLYAAFMEQTNWYLKIFQSKSFNKKRTKEELEELRLNASRYVQSGRRLLSELQDDIDANRDILQTLEEMFLSRGLDYYLKRTYIDNDEIDKRYNELRIQINMNKVSNDGIKIIIKQINEIIPVIKKIINKDYEKIAKICIRYTAVVSKLYLQLVKDELRYMSDMVMLVSATTDMLEKYTELGVPSWVVQRHRRNILNA